MIGILLLGLVAAIGAGKTWTRFCWNLKKAW